MSAIFLLDKESPKTTNFFVFLKNSYFIMGGPIDMNVDVF